MIYNLGAATETAVQNVTTFMDVCGSCCGNTGVVRGSGGCGDVVVVGLFSINSDDDDDDANAYVEQASDHTGIDMDGGCIEMSLLLLLLLETAVVDAIRIYILLELPCTTATDMA